MYELGITRDLLRSALQEAKQQSASRIVGLDLAVGELSGLTEDSMKFYFALLSRGTLAEGAALHFHPEAPQADCYECSGHFDLPLSSGPIACPSCGGRQIRLSGGTSSYLRGIDLEREHGT